jgi:hypothetical protein
VVTGIGVEQHDAESLDLLRVGDQVDPDDAPCGEVERDRAEQPPARRPRDAGNAADERQPRRLPAAAHQPRHRVRAERLRIRPQTGRLGVGPQHDVRIEHGEQAVEVAGA